MRTSCVIWDIENWCSNRGLLGFRLSFEWSRWRIILVVYVGFAYLLLSSFIGNQRASVIANVLWHCQVYAVVYLRPKNNIHTQSTQKDTMSFQYKRCTHAGCRACEWWLEAHIREGAMGSSADMHRPKHADATVSQRPCCGGGTCLSPLTLNVKHYPEAIILSIWMSGMRLTRATWLHYHYYHCKSDNIHM